MVKNNLSYSKIMKTTRIIARLLMVFGALELNWPKHMPKTAKTNV